VADSLFSLARQTPFIGPKLSEALGRAVQQLSTSGRELATGNRSRGEDAARGAGASLNEAILELRATEQSMCENPGSGMPRPSRQGRQQRGESMDKLSQRQDDLNQRTRTMSRRLSEQLRMQTGDREELERLAEEQQRIREQMAEIRRDEEERQELLGRLDQTEREMKEVEEMLRDGASDPALEEKQTRILSRMLDATRSLNRRDFEPQRESRPGEDIARGSPAELPPELLRENDRLRLDLLKAEADRYPAQYRSFIEAYLRSLNGSPK
jgi:myosin heavy subunit